MTVKHQSRRTWYVMALPTDRQLRSLRTLCSTVLCIRSCNVGWRSCKFCFYNFTQLWLTLLLLSWILNFLTAFGMHSRQWDRDDRPCCTDLKLEKKDTKSIRNSQRVARLAVLTMRMLSSYAEINWSVATFSYS